MARVYLRSLLLTDAERIAKLANDYDIAYNISEWGSFPNPYTREDAVDFISRAEIACADKTGFTFGICLKDTDELAGACGLNSVNYKNRRCEIGYWIGRDYQKKGYAFGAVGLLVEFAFQKLGMNRVYAITFLFNTGSSALLERLGFKREGVLRQDVFHKDRFENNLLFSVLREEREDNQITVLE